MEVTTSDKGKRRQIALVFVVNVGVWSFIIWNIGIESLIALFGSPIPEEWPLHLGLLFLAIIVSQVPRVLILRGNLKRNFLLHTKWSFRAFVGIIIVMLVPFYLVYVATAGKTGVPTAIALGGSFSNLFETAKYRIVMDYIPYTLRGRSYLANLADLLMTVGLVGIVLAILI